MNLKIRKMTEKSSPAEFCNFAGANAAVDAEFVNARFSPGLQSDSCKVTSLFTVSVMSSAFIWRNRSANRAPIMA